MHLLIPLSITWFQDGNITITGRQLRTVGSLQPLNLDSPMAVAQGVEATDLELLRAQTAEAYKKLERIRELVEPYLRDATMANALHLAEQVDRTMRGYGR